MLLDSHARGHPAINLRCYYLLEMSYDAFVVHRMKVAARRSLPAAQALADRRTFDLFAVMCCALLQGDLRRDFHLRG